MDSSGPSLRYSSTSSLSDKLAKVLPEGHRFNIYHLSTPPTRTNPLCSAPPRGHADRTYCETHFLTVSIDLPSGATTGADEDDRKQPLILGLEILIFSTAYLTTLFVSKADSTGYLTLLDLPRGTPPPIREVACVFITHLLENRQRKGIQCAINLFARAQPQYLFPGSADNGGKHILSDYGLLRWWCRVLNPLLESGNDALRRGQWTSVKGYIVVPGLDVNEIRSLLPRTSSRDANWVLGHPLEEISHYAREYDWVPLRCLIPRYPDDPKSRFRDELDAEASEWNTTMGVWKSVKSLDQFWEMMIFRQECSSGRLTGFIWVVFDTVGSKSSEPADALTASPSKASDAGSTGRGTSTPLSTPPRRRADIASTPLPPSPLKKMDCATGSPTSPDAKQKTSAKSKKKMKKKTKLTGPIVPRRPHVKTEHRNYLLERLLKRPTTTPYYLWSPEARGQRIVSETDYKRIVELLLHLDFKTLDKADASTRRWISEAGAGTGWGKEIVGKRRLAEGHVGSGGSGPASKKVTNLTGLVRKKAKVETESGKCGAVRIGTSDSTAPRETCTASDMPQGPGETGEVRVLSPSLVRKRPKAG